MDTFAHHLNRVAVVVVVVATLKVAVKLWYKTIPGHQHLSGLSGSVCIGTDRDNVMPAVGRSGRMLVCVTHTRTHAPLCEERAHDKI